MNEVQQWKNTGGQFPVKLYAMLESADALSPDVVAWLPHGRAFRVLDEDKLVESIAPFFFKQTKIRSFYRQLNLWGFNRLAMGCDAGAWSHQFFLRGSPGQIKKMIRTKIKSKQKKSDNPIVCKRVSDFSDTQPLPIPTKYIEATCHHAKQPSTIAERYQAILSEARLVLSIDSALSVVSHQNDSFRSIGSSVPCSDPSNNKLNVRMSSNIPSHSQPIDHQAATLTSSSSWNDISSSSFNAVAHLPFKDDLTSTATPINNLNFQKSPRMSHRHIDIQAVTPPISTRFNEAENTFLDTIEPLPFRDDVPFDDLVLCLGNVVHVL